MPTTIPPKTRLTFRELLEKIKAMPAGADKARATELAWRKYGEKPAGANVFKKFEKVRYNPIEYIKVWLRWTAWLGIDEAHPGQGEILKACARVMQQQHEKDLWEKGELKTEELTVWNPDRKHPDNSIQNWIRVESGNGIGKCLWYNDLMLLADGRRVEARELVDRDFCISTLSSSGEIVKTRATAFDNGRQPVYELITETGRKIKRTGNHPMWATTPNFRPSRQPLIERGNWIPLEEIKSGDLVAVAENLAVFGDKSLPLEEIKLIAYLIGDGGLTRNTVRFSQQESPQLEEYKICAEKLGCRLVRLNDYDYIAYGRGEKRGNTVINPLIDLMREHALMGKNSHEKFVPDAIFELPKNELAVFLSRLFSTDGWASFSKTGARQIGFCSVSERLIRDVSHLLLRFGVHGRISFKPQVKAWNYVITHSNDQMAFIEQIGIFGKEKAVARIAEIADHHRQKRIVQCGRRPDRPRWVHKNAHPNTRWEKVVSVRYVGDEPTVGIEVPVYDTYLNDFYEHNTKSASGIVNWFLDCFVPSAIFTYAPGGDQARFVIWSEIRADREAKGLPGRILEAEIKVSAKHFAAHRTVSVGKGLGEERAKGKHEKYQLFVLDEAEGIDSVIFDAIVSQTSGGQNLVVMFANPKSRASMFHRIKNRSYVQTFRVSTLFHPNVVAGKEIIPNAVKRDFVEKKIENDCEIIHGCAEDCELSAEEHEKLHCEDEFTFDLPYGLTVGGTYYAPGSIFKPNARFMTDILGITPPNSTDKTVIPVGRFEAACKRIPTGEGDKTRARVGIDASRSGADNGTMYVRHLDAIRRALEIPTGDTYDYISLIVPELLKLKDKGVTSLHIRIDAAYGSGLIDVLRRNDELRKAFADYKVFEVWFGGESKNKEYYNTVTEMYYEAAESIKSVCIVGAPERLEIDLCEREYEWRNVKGKDAKILEPKEEFKKRKKHSPDDGDGFVLAIAPDYLFKGKEMFAPKIIGKTSRWR